MEIIELEKHFKDKIKQLELVTSEQKILINNLTTALKDVVSNAEERDKFYVQRLQSAGNDISLLANALTRVTNEFVDFRAKAPLFGKRAYRLKYFQGSKEDEKIFLFDGGLNDAILEGRRHCDVMTFRFGAVRPSIVDLKHQENLKIATNREWNDSMEEPADMAARKAKSIQQGLDHEEQIKKAKELNA